VLAMALRCGAGSLGFRVRVYYRASLGFAVTSTSWSHRQVKLSEGNYNHSRTGKPLLRRVPQAPAAPPPRPAHCQWAARTLPSLPRLLSSRPFTSTNGPVAFYRPPLGTKQDAVLKQRVQAAAPELVLRVRAQGREVCTTTRVHNGAPLTFRVVLILTSVTRFVVARPLSVQGRSLGTPSRRPIVVSPPDELRSFPRVECLL
jgi:hypothetical protein